MELCFEKRENRGSGADAGPRRTQTLHNVGGELIY